MKKIISVVIILVLVCALIKFFETQNINSNSSKKLYNINSNFYHNYLTQQNFIKNINSLFIEDTVYCSIGDNLQNKINKSIGKTLILSEGVHYSYMLKIPSNIKIIIPKNTTVKLADDLIIDQSLYPEAVGDAVIKIIGDENKFLENIFIELDGKIDGNKLVHPYNKGGVEGIDIKWSKKIYIYGTGSIINANGDGLDIDVSNNLYIDGINFLNNDGCGVHFGSPRPIKSSFNNLVIGCYAANNGFDRKRAGFDQSWPNINAVTYFNCFAENNYKNWDIKGSGALILNPYFDPTKKIDSFEDALFHNLSADTKSNSKKLNQVRVYKTGYYFLSTKKNKNLNSSHITINGYKMSTTNVFSKNFDNQVSIGIYFLQKNDILKVSSSLSDTLKKQHNNIESIRLDLITPLDDIYYSNYDFKILIWKLKSKCLNFAGEIYHSILK